MSKESFISNAVDIQPEGLAAQYLTLEEIADNEMPKRIEGIEFTANELKARGIKVPKEPGKGWEIDSRNVLVNEHWRVCNVYRRKRVVPAESSEQGDMPQSWRT